MKVVIVNGAPGSGKTTFESICEGYLGWHFCRSRSTVDKVKEIAEMCGWDGAKTLENRKFLSDLKDLLTNYNDLPFTDIIDYKDAFSKQLVNSGLNEKMSLLFVDDREPAHIERIKKELGAVTLLIRRDISENNPTSNHADANVLNYNYDYVINNNGTLKDLEEQAIEFLKFLGLYF